MTPAEKYAHDIAWGLRWNVANAHLYKPGIWAVVTLTYDKTSKGKTRPEKVTLGVVPKDEVGKFINELAAKWVMFDLGLREANKPTPSISNLKFTSFAAHIGWRRGDEIIDDAEIERRHGVIDLEKAFKMLKSL